jgi:uncharacterized membrane-anchored protein YitT (DUF2179 family)
MKRMKPAKMCLPGWRQIGKGLQTGLLLVIGATLAAFGYALFQVPFNIVAGGLSGVSLVINHFSGWPVGLMYWLMNAPLLILGYYNLGRWRFVIRTLFAATVFSIATDVFVAYLPHWIDQFPLTNDLLLSSIYGGIVGGISAGLVYRTGSTFGGTGIIGRVIQQRTGLPLSQAYLYTDGVIIAVAGLVFGWEIALYGVLVLFINGLATDYTMEGASSTRTATIVTNHPEAVANALMRTLHRGVSYWPVTGAYTGKEHFMLMVTLARSQVTDVKQVVAATDPEAFLTIGVSNRAMGKGFSALRSQK